MLARCIANAGHATVRLDRSSSLNSTAWLLASSFAARFVVDSISVNYDDGISQRAMTISRSPSLWLCTAGAGSRERRRVGMTDDRPGIDRPEQPPNRVDIPSSSNRRLHIPTARPATMPTADRLPKSAFVARQRAARDLYRILAGRGCTGRERGGAPHRKARHAQVVFVERDACSSKRRCNMSRSRWRRPPAASKFLPHSMSIVRQA